MAALWVIFLVLIGACVGSFLNVVVYRLPRGESIVFPPSHCPKCGRKIHWYDNIPLLSWFLLRGRCRFCNTPISPRYPLVEGATAFIVAGLYVCYYLLEIRDGAGTFGESWVTFIAHAGLLCGLFACSLIDMDKWIIPLEVCWFISLLGVAAAGAGAHPWMPTISPAAGAMTLGAAAGLIVALILAHYGLIQRSFIDAYERPRTNEVEGGQRSSKGAKKSKSKIVSVAVTSDQGVYPRREIIRELVFLAPALVGAVVAYALVSNVAIVKGALATLTEGGGFAKHSSAFLAALFGYFVGGLWIWGTRILGTLGFGKEAMGLGDVHLMAAVGAVCGWIVPSIAFFIAPLFGLLWALYLWLGRNQRELPYGPWLAIASLVVLLFYDAFDALMRPYVEALGF